MDHHFNTDPLQAYDGPDFDEFCISESKYLRAQRDRTRCSTCALSNLCQAGFEHQVALVVEGKDPSLTKDCQLTADELTADRLLDGLSQQQIDFVRMHIPGLAKETRHV
jgi:hypothetical protein